MREFHRIWIEQCEAAEGIRAQYGIDKALGYLIGEKLFNFIDVSRNNAQFRAELPAFVARIHEMFPPAEIRRYLNGVRHVGAPAHVLSEEQYEEMSAAGAFEQSPASTAQDILTFEELKRLLDVP